MITGKRPTDDIFSNSVDIHLFTAMALPQDAWRIIDPSILFEETRREGDIEEEIQEMAIMSEEDCRETMPRWMEECLISMMKIGLSCSLRAPSERTSSMNDVVNELQAIKSTYLKLKKARRRFR